MLSAHEALDLILENTHPKKPVSVALDEAHGLVLQGDVKAYVDLPGFDNSAMDGFAVRAGDLSGATENKPISLKIMGDIPAGRVFPKKIQAGECAQIMTGAPIPRGADAVVMKEDVQRLGAVAVFLKPTVAGDNVRFRAEDIRKGEKVLSGPLTLGAAQIALLAAQGVSRVKVIPRVSVGIVVTGDELVRPGSLLRPGKICDSNSFMLLALAQECGAEGIFLGVARDERRSLTLKIRQVMQRDVAIISGGVSVGTFDYVKEVSKEMGVREIFWRVKVKPGMPLFFGVRGETLVFGLPGNPVSGFVLFHEFIRPALHKMMGHLGDSRTQDQAILAKDISKRAGKTVYVRVLCTRQNGQWVATPSGAQGSHSLKSLVHANALAVLPEESEKFKTGEKVPIKFIQYDRDHKT